MTHGELGVESEQPIVGVGTVGKVATGTVSMTAAYMRVSSVDQRFDRQAEEIARAVHRCAS